MSYSSYDHDNLETAETMKIERQIYFESEKADLSEAVKLPLAELLSLRAESAAAEQEVFDRLKEQAAAWEEQAGRTLFLDKALEYARTLPVTHTAKNISHSGKVSNDSDGFDCINRCFRCSCGKFVIVHGVQAAIGFLAAATGEKRDLPETHPVQPRTESIRPCRLTRAKPASKGLGRALSV